MRIEEYTAQELFELLEMKGKGKATYYVPGGRFPDEKSM